MDIPKGRLEIGQLKGWLLICDWNTGKQLIMILGPVRQTINCYQNGSCEKTDSFCLHNLGSMVLIKTDSDLEIP